MLNLPSPIDRGLFTLESILLVHRLDIAEPFIIFFGLVFFEAGNIFLARLEACEIKFHLSNLLKKDGCNFLLESPFIVLLIIVKQTSKVLLLQLVCCRIIELHYIALGVSNNNMI